MRASRTDKTESPRNRDTIGRPVRLSYVRTETTTGIVPGLSRRVRWGTRAGWTVGSVGALRDRWSVRSLASVWPATAAEWECPAVDAVCEGLVESGAARPHLTAAARCFFSKTLDGIGALPDAHYRQLDPELLDVLVVGRPIAAE